MNTTKLIPQMLIPTFGIYLLSLLSQNIDLFSEWHLIILNLFFAFLLLFSQLRSQLIRRRLQVNIWFRQESYLRKLLQGGVIYSSLRFLLVLPFALLLVAELQHLQTIQWRVLIYITLFTSVGKLIIERKLRLILYPNPASILSREWMTIFFTCLAIPCLCYLNLYTSKIDLQGLSLEQVIIQSSSTDQSLTSNLHGGIFSAIQNMSMFKETCFWWLFLNLKALMMGFPEWMFQIAHYTLLTLYLLYSVSIVYILSRAIAGLLEIADPYFYKFLKNPVMSYQWQRAEDYTDSSVMDLPAP
jgi:hypothetical protein